MQGNVPMICDGCDCYILQNSTWIETASVNNCRYYASSVALSSNQSLNSSQQMIIGGGFYYDVLSGEFQTFKASGVLYILTSIHFLMFSCMKNIFFV